MKIIKDKLLILLTFLKSEMKDKIFDFTLQIDFLLTWNTKSNE